MNFRFFSSNKKTGYSYDFGVCPLMKRVNGKFKAFCGVDKCYSASLLNGIRGKVMTGKMEDLPNRFDLIDHELKYLNALAMVEEDFLLRGFSFGDYMPEFEEAFLRIVRGFNGRHIIISKNLWLKGSRELLEEVSEKTILSLGFTKQLYPKFKTWFENNSDLKFSIAYTYNNIKELHWLKVNDPELFELVDVFHDAEIHMRATKMYTVDKKTGQYSKTALGMQRKHAEHLKDITAVDEGALYRQCNIYGNPSEVKGCKSCNGCEVMRRFESVKAVA